MKWTLRVLLSISIAGLLLVLLMVWGGVSPRDVFATLRSLPPGVFVLALGLHVFTYCMRALRFRVLIPRRFRPGFRRTLTIAAAHNMASYLLPAKTGEASFVLYMRIHASVPGSVGLAALLVARFLDAAILCLALSSTCFYLAGEPRFAALTWLGTAGGLLVAAAGLFLVLSLRGDLIVRAVQAMLRWIRLHHFRRGEALLLKANNLVEALRSERNGRLGLGLLTSVPMWCSVFGFYALLARAMGMPDWVKIPEATFGAALGMLFNLLPVNGAAGMGTQELGWVAGFHRFLGVDSELALSTGIGVHLVQLFNIVAMGFLAHLAMGAMPRVRDFEEEAQRGVDPDPEPLTD
ncbi:MAG TPA: flippase-like domain-containing protein [Planctomycetes bacterium]|nr:flippase-like domain-containing protein [Planctomycetota bacterium]